MARARRKRDGRLIRRRFGVVVSLLAYLLASGGLPLPAAACKKGDQPFACQTRSCGCQVPADSQSGCCCQSPAPIQKEPSPEPDCPHCAGKAECDDSSTSCDKPCCDKKHKPAKKAAPLRQASPACLGGGVVWIDGFKARQCKGGGTLWITTGAVMLPPTMVIRQTPLDAVDRVRPAELTASSRSSKPSVPPPR
jgi:hypothetical protein